MSLGIETPRVGRRVKSSSVEVPVKGPIKGSIIKSKYKDIYKKNGDYSCGDDLSGEIRAFIAVNEKGRMRVDESKLKRIAEDNGVWKGSYASLNLGQRRMTIGNCLRSLMREGKEVNIGGAMFGDPALFGDPGLKE